MKKNFYLLFTAIVFLSIMNIWCGKKNTDTPEERFLQECISYHRKALQLSDAKKVCECILTQAKDSNIDLYLFAHEYKKHRMDPYTTFGDTKMRKIRDDCFKPVMTSVKSRNIAIAKKNHLDTTLGPANIEQKFLFPLKTHPTKKIYITFTTENGRTFLVQSDNANGGKAGHSSMSASEGGLGCWVAMSFFIDSIYSGNQMNLVGKTVPLQSFSVQISDWRSGNPKEIWKQVSSDFNANNYVYIDSLTIDPSKALKVRGTIHCAMTTDGRKFIHKIDDGKFSLFWFF
jgi:hypothetical protein